jgi:hypothetical protein
MAKRQTKTRSANALKKLMSRDKGTFEEVKDSDPTIKGQQLPGGLTNVKVQLAGANLVVTDEGDPNIRFLGVVLDPEEYAGYQVNHSFVIADTPFKTGKERIAELKSHLQLMGVDTSQIKLQDIEQHLFDLAEDAPIFVVNTNAWAIGDKSGVAKHVQGLWDEEASKEEVVLPPEEDDYEEPIKEKTPIEEEPAEEVAVDDDGVDPEAKTKPDEVDPDWVPQVGDIYRYKEKTIKVKTVDSDATTISGQNTETRGLLRDVPWEDLEDAED